MGWLIVQSGKLAWQSTLTSARSWLLVEFGEITQILREMPWQCTIENVLSAAAGRDQSGLREHAQVMRDSCHGEHVAIAQFATEEFLSAISNMGIDTETRRVSERLSDQRRF
jgi:hypothetical protein